MMAPCVAEGVDGWVTEVKQGGGAICSAAQHALCHRQGCWRARAVRARGPGYQTQPLSLPEVHPTPHSFCNERHTSGECCR